MSQIASPGQLRWAFLRRAVITVPLILFLGSLSGKIAGSGEANGWFASLNRPEIYPPAWAFPVVWTLLYILLGLALAMILHARGTKGRGVAVSLFILQMLMNFAWSPLFFAAHQLEAGFWLIVAMFGTALLATLSFWRIRKMAAVLMLPYLGWLAFAGFLNFQFWQLNLGAPAPSGASETMIVLPSQ